MSKADRATVALVRAGEDLVGAIDEALRLCGQGDCVAKGDRVLLKPNIHGGQGFTSPQVMEAACRWALGKGARKVFLGDGPYWGMKDPTTYFAHTGLLGACAATGAEVADFHNHPYHLLHPEDPLLPPVMGISRYLYDVDVVISLPLMKTHFHTLITIALKNLKGCLRPVDKRRLHERELNTALAAVNELVQPLVRVTLCDATTAYEGFGPGSATPVPLGLLVASADPVAVDVVCCELMELPPAQVRLIRECAARGLGVGDPRQITVVGETVAAHRRRFLRPSEALARDYPGLTIHSESACSVCAQNLTLALQQIKQAGEPLTVREVLIGAGPQTEADLLVGNCARRGREGHERAVPGCAPTVAAIRKALTEG